jgi:hypothetical protein
LQEAAKRRQEMAATKQAEQRSHEAPGDFFEAPKKITVSPEKHGAVKKITVCTVPGKHLEITQLSPQKDHSKPS